MWILYWKKYKFSKFATFISIVGALMRYAAVLCIFSALIPAFVICGAIGVGLHFLAEKLGTDKWKKMLEKEGYTEKIKSGDLNAAITVYNSSPSKATLKFITSLNAQVSQSIEAQIKK